MGLISRVSSRTYSDYFQRKVMQRLCAKRLLATTAKLQDVNHITIIGAGQMGAGIAQVSAQSGINVTMVDLDQKMLDKANATIEKSMSRVLSKKFGDDPEKAKTLLADIMGRVTTSTDANSAAAKSDLVCEAVAENLALKQRLFQGLDEACQASTIFASNTSSLSIGDIAKTCSAERQA